MIRHEHVQHLRRPDSIEQLNAKLSFPFFAEMRRQRFTRRDTQAQTRAVQFLSTPVMLEQQVVHDWNSKKDRWAALSKDPRDYISRRLLATNNRGRSVQQWK